MVIAFEGIDGSGKTSMIKIVKESLEIKGYSVLTFGTPLFVELNSAELISNARNDVSCNDIDILSQAYIDDSNALQALLTSEYVSNFNFVLLDRSILSYIIYSKFLYGCSVEILSSKIKSEFFFDYCFYLSVDVGESCNRLRHTRGKLEKWENFTNLKLLSDEYSKTINALSFDEKIITLDNSNEICQKENINLILNLVHRYKVS
jgi:dTMP kinase